MIKIELLTDESEMRVFAKGSGVLNKTFRMWFTEVEGVPCLAIDTSEDQYGIGIVQLEEIKKAIDKELERHPKRSRHIAGYTSRPIKLPGIPVIAANTPIEKFNNRIFVDLGDRHLSLDPKADYIRYI